MKKLILILLLCVLVATIGFTFFLKFEKKESQITTSETSAVSSSTSSTEIPPLNNVISESSSISSSSLKSADNSPSSPEYNACHENTALLDKMLPFDTYVPNATDRFTLSLPKTWRYWRDTDPSLQLSTPTILTSPDELSYLQNLPCVKDNIDFRLGIFVNFDPTYQPEFLDDKVVAQAITKDGIVVNIYSPSRTLAGHLEAHIPTGGAYVSVSSALMGNRYKEQLDDIKTIIQGISLRKAEELTSDSVKVSALMSAEWYEPIIIHETTERVWFKPLHEKDGCNYLLSFNKETAEYGGTEYRSCPPLNFSETTPLFFKTCDGYYDLSACLNYSKLLALNLDTGEEVEILDTSKKLKVGETYVKNCGEGIYDQGCGAEMSISDGILTIGIFKEVYRPQQYQDKYDPTQPREFTHEKIRDISVDLTKFY